MRTVHLDTITSTNDYARTLAQSPDDREPVLITADCQTGGRGQRGNTWESEPGMNATFTLVVCPDMMSAARQFELSMIVSIATVGALRAYVPDPELLHIKWPNDIYYSNHKLGGILIENTVADGNILRSIIGIGINANQRTFHSDAPNPVSLIQIDPERHTDIAALTDDIATNILDMLRTYTDDPEVDQLTALYNSLLWRRDGLEHPWRDTATGQEFAATLERVEPDGRLFLRHASGQEHSYLFKEVMAAL